MSDGVRLGLRPNLPQFLLLVVVNAFVGGMVGLERSILPALAEQEFRLAARTAILSFIVVFGVVKALTNYFAGRFCDRWGRKPVLIAGWLIASPVPFLLMWAPSWDWILIANALLGASQGLTWSATVIMKIDLVGSDRRGLAMGLNEFAGYLAVALAALATGYIAATHGLRPQPFYLGVVFVAVALPLSIFLVRETRAHSHHEATTEWAPEAGPSLSPLEVFARTSMRDKDLSSVSQAGLVNNLNDGMAWGLFPLLFAAQGLSLKQIASLVAVYPAVWGVGQLVTGAASDRIGRKWLIASGMWVQALGIAVVAGASGVPAFAAGSVLLGVGTAMVYPTLLAVIGDVAHPAWRASAVGVYRLWRDLGYAVGALISGAAADLIGVRPAVGLVAGLTFGSGLIVAFRMRETLRQRPDAGRSETTAGACLTAADLRKRLAAGERVLIVDVRSPEEFATRHIEESLNLPLDVLRHAPASLDPVMPVVTVCGKGGGRSEQAARLLRARGHREAYALCGGTRAWFDTLPKAGSQGGQP